MNKLTESILERYFRAHRDLIEAEEVDDRSVVVSFPIYFSANHRVELSVTQLPSGDFQISDMARTIVELKLAGISVAGKTKERLVNLASNSKIRFVGNNMIRDCTPDQLGEVLHLFADSAKTIGDVYLAHRSRVETEDELRRKVKRVLLDQKYNFKEYEQVRGEIETHQIDFFIPPNGVPGIALSVLSKPTRLTAEAWAFKAADIKVMHKQLKVGLVYGVESTKDEQKEVITRKIDIPIPSSDLGALQHGLAHLLK
jgi:hypothetical protein